MLLLKLIVSKQPSATNLVGCLDHDMKTWQALLVTGDMFQEQVGQFIGDSNRTSLKLPAV